MNVKLLQRGPEGFEPPKYLSNLIAAVNDGAKAAQSGALAFALVGVYLLATAFSASDEDLLRGRAVTISQIGATLPLSFSFAIAPFVFVFLHIYTLARYDMLASNVRQFLSELRRTVRSKLDQERCRQLLANVEFVHALAAPRASQLYSWVWRWLVRVMIAGFPVFVLLLVQVNALRYQSLSILRVQRAWLAIDLLALVWFFYRNPLRGDTLRIRRWVGWLQQRGAAFARSVPRNEPEQPEGATGRPPTPRRRLAVLSCLALLIASINFAYFNVVPPDADPTVVRYDLKSGPDADNKLKHYTIDAFITGNPLDLILCPDLKWGCRYLSVDQRTLVDHVWDDKAIIELWRGTPDKARALAAIEGLTLRNRSLRFAMLDGSSLIGANLAGADLRKASLQYAMLLSVTLTGAHLQGADLSSAQLQGADLSSAELQGTILRLTQLQGANLDFAQLPAAPLGGAPLQGANLSQAWLQCADLRAAQLQGANLRDAHLQGADLGSAQLEGADLRDTQLYGAAFGSVKRSDATDWPKTNLRLSDLRNADTSKILAQPEREQINSMIELVPDTAGAKCLKRLIQQSGDPSRASDKPTEPLVHSGVATLLRETAGDPMLAGTPTASYTNSLVEYLADQLPGNNSAIAGGIAQRVLANLGDADDDIAPVGCQLVANAQAGKVKLDPQTALLLSSQLQLRGINCKPIQAALKPGAD
jgi:uncharacterized protein YjbI with pentapeptide repeats